MYKESTSAMFDQNPRLCSKKPRMIKKPSGTKSLPKAASGI